MTLFVRLTSSTVVEELVCGISGEPVLHPVGNLPARAAFLLPASLPRMLLLQQVSRDDAAPANPCTRWIRRRQIRSCEDPSSSLTALPLPWCAASPLLHGQRLEEAGDLVTRSSGGSPAPSSAPRRRRHLLCSPLRPAWGIKPAWRRMRPASSMCCMKLELHKL